MLYKRKNSAAREKIMRERLCEVKESMEKLQEAYALCEKKHRAQSLFVNRMSHDMRTPLNSIMGYAALIERYAHEQESVRHYSQRIYESGRTLMELINDVLDMGCIESGNIKLTESTFSLNPVFEEVAAALMPQIEAKQQKFRFYMSNSTGKDVVSGDKRKFCQVLRNIMSNAVKYTGERGNIELIVNVHEAAGNELQLTYQVKDTGCGMSKEFIERIFEPYRREENEISIGIPGTGLGMCIVKSFVELMNGSVLVESETGTGTVVTVTMPLKHTMNEKVEERMRFSSSSELSGMHFLIAEDNDSNAEILKEVLSSMGAECTIAVNGLDALDIFENSEVGRFDMILMDARMPVMNGYEAAGKIRCSNHPDAKTIKIIAMTADAFEEDIRRAMVSGMDAHVAKPLDIQSFVETIKKLEQN